MLVSDIPANCEVDLPQERFFRCGDVDDLREKLESLSGLDFVSEERAALLGLIEEKYNWDKIAEQTIAVYQKALESSA